MLPEIGWVNTSPPMVSQLSFQSCVWLVNSGTHAYGVHYVTEVACSSCQVLSYFMLHHWAQHTPELSCFLSSSLITSPYVSFLFNNLTFSTVFEHPRLCRGKYNTGRWRTVLERCQWMVMGAQGREPGWTSAGGGGVLTAELSLLPLASVRKTE